MGSSSPIILKDTALASTLVLALEFPESMLIRSYAVGVTV
jgi:hypothetical protein